MKVRVVLAIVLWTSMAVGAAQLFDGRITRSGSRDHPGRRRSARRPGLRRRAGPVAPVALVAPTGANPSSSRPGPGGCCSSTPASPWRSSRSEGPESGPDSLSGGDLRRRSPRRWRRSYDDPSRASGELMSRFREFSVRYRQSWPRRGRAGDRGRRLRRLERQTVDVADDRRQAEDGGQGDDRCRQVAVRGSGADSGFAG